MKDGDKVLVVTQWPEGTPGSLPRFVKATFGHPAGLLGQVREATGHDCLENTSCFDMGGVIPGHLLPLRDVVEVEDCMSEDRRIKFLMRMDVGSLMGPGDRHEHWIDPVNEKADETALPEELLACGGMTDISYRGVGWEAPEDGTGFGTLLLEVDADVGECLAEFYADAEMD